MLPPPVRRVVVCSHGWCSLNYADIQCCDLHPSCVWLLWWRIAMITRTAAYCVCTRRRHLFLLSSLRANGNWIWMHAVFTVYSHCSSTSTFSVWITFASLSWEREREKVTQISWLAAQLRPATQATCVYTDRRCDNVIHWEDLALVMSVHLLLFFPHSICISAGRSWKV